MWEHELDLAGLEPARSLESERQREPAPARPGRGRRWFVLVRELVETLLLAVLIFLAVRSAVQNFKVEGDSMFPSLENGQYIIVNKLAYAQIDLGKFDWIPFFDPGDSPVHHLLGTPGRGDVIVFRSPTNPDRDFIKRVIGVPGDTVEIRSGVVYVNEEPLEESYTTGNTGCPCGPWVVEPGKYFVLGDHRNNSSDSRVIGAITEESIIGKALFSYWPLSEVGLAPNHSVSFASGESP
jgi:signal peptidase I